jgi:hypothetical protein
MGDKKHKNTQIGIGEINTIREILMGSKFDEMERQLKALQHDMENMRLDFDNSLKELKTTIKQNGKSMRGDMLKKIVDLENRMVRGHDKAINKIKQDKIDQTSKLAKIFTKLGKEIKTTK